MRCLCTICKLVVSFLNGLFQKILDLTVDTAQLLLRPHFEGLIEFGADPKKEWFARFHVVQQSPNARLSDRLSSIWRTGTWKMLASRFAHLDLLDAGRFSPSSRTTG